MGTVRAKILSLLPESRHVSRKVESETFKAHFTAEWGLASFLDEQYQGQASPEELLAKVITLTGSTSDTQALPCSEYLRQTWPWSGERVLRAVSRALAARLTREKCKLLPYHLDKSSAIAPSQQEAMNGFI